MKMERVYSLRVCGRMIAMWALVVLGALDAQAEGVPVPLNVEFVRVDSGASVDGVVSKEDTPGDACIFVLDHSSSMDKEDAIVCTEWFWGGMRNRKTSRWEALLASFAVTLDQIEPGTVVQVVRVSADHAELVRFGDQSRVLIAGAQERNEILKAVKNWKKPHGRTPLYHGLFLACQEAKHLIETENRSVTIVVFSDGKDESDNGYTQEQVDAFKELFDDAAFAACLTWIGDVNKGLPAPPFGPKFVWAQPPKSGNVVPPICRVRSSKPSVRVGNPLSASGRVEVPVSYVFSLDTGKWDELVRSGVVANLQLVGQADGQVYGGEGVTVGPEGGRLEFRVPSECFEGASGAEFMVTMGLPEMAGGCRLVPAHPVRVSFEGQGSATISDVNPPTGLTVKVGESIQFAAEGTEGATWKWAFGDGHSANGQRGKHAYTAAAPEGIEFTVTAKKSGLQSATATGSVTVVEAGVALEAMPSGLKVGDSTEFRCRGTGEVASYDWFVDDAPVAGAEMAPDGSTGRLVATFDRAGRHTVRVRANMKRVSPEETQNVPFDVSPAPYAAVTSPTPNETFEAESAIDLVAHVEGGAATGIWRIDMADGSPASDPIPAPVVGGTAQAKFTPPASGGTFAVTFEAGEGADAAQSAPVRFSAKSKDVRLDVTEPVPGATVSTGDKLTLRAVTKGLSGTVEFWVEAEDSASAKIGESKVAADGTVALAHVFPAKDGQGSRILVARSADGGITSDPVEFTLETPAGLVLKRPAQNASVTYGGTLDFEAEVDGAVEAGAVRWFLRPLGGGEEALHDAKGAHYEHRFEAVANRKSIPYEIYARAPLPDGTEIETDHVTVRAECPALAPRLLTAEKVYETGVPVTFRAEHAGTAGRVVWDFGEGETAEGTEDQAAHTFDKTGKRHVRATLTCATCGEEASAETTVELRCPDLAPRLDIVGESSEASEENLFARGKPIRMSVTCEGRGAAGRMKDVSWTFGDGEGETGLDTVNHSYRDYGERTVAVTVKCAACGREEKATRTLRIDKVPPKAHFKICRSTSSEKPLGGWVAQGTTIALVDQDHGAGDTAHSTGDVAQRRWTCDGEPIPGSEDRNIVEWDCRTVGKHVFELTVFDPLGEPAAPESHSVRVYRLWLILLLLALAAGASGWAWWLWSGDAPRFWKVGVRDDPENKLSVEEAWEVKCKHSLKRYWKRAPNVATIPLTVVAKWTKASEQEWGKVEKKRDSEEASLHVKASTTDSEKDTLTPYMTVVGPASRELQQEREKNGFLLKISKSSSGSPGKVVALWVKVATQRGPNTDLWVRVALTLAFFTLAAWGIAKWGA